MSSRIGHRWSNGFGVYRLLDDGAIDTDFQNGLSSLQLGYLNEVRLVVQSDGRILLLGTRETLGRVSWPGIVRLNSDGSLDRSFQPGIGATFAFPGNPGYRLAGVLAAAVQSDGKIVIGGQFTHYQGLERAGITRLLADGAPDPSFSEFAGVEWDGQPRHPPFAMVRALALTGDGGILGGGNFTSAEVGGNSRQRLIAQWSPDGIVRSLFFLHPALQGGSVDVLAPRPDGSTLIGGDFQTSRGSRGVVRLSSEGSTDPKLLVNLFGVRSLAVQPDGRIVVAGYFEEIDGVPRRYLARFFADSTVHRAVEFESRGYETVEDRGEIVATVVRRGASGEAFGVEVTTRDGSAKAGIDYTSVSTTLNFAPGERSRSLRIPVLDNGRVDASRSFEIVLARPSGGVLAGATSETRVTLRDDEISAAIDTGFDPDLDGSVRAVVRQPDGRVVIGGDFTHVDGQARDGIARLEADGTLDRGFVARLGIPSQCCVSVRTLALQSDGRLLVGGYLHEGTSSKALNDDLVRLLPDGTFDLTFVPATTTIPGYFPGPATALAVDAEGRILVGDDQSVVRLMPDGRPDPGFKVEPALGSRIRKIDVRPDGKILVIGQFGEMRGGNGRLARRLEADGSPDPTYQAVGTDPESGVEFAQALAIQSDGKVYVTGSLPSDAHPSTRAVLARLTATGAVDPTFGYLAAGSGGADWSQNISAVGFSADGRLFVASEGTDPLRGTMRGFLQATGPGEELLAFDPRPTSGFWSPAIETILDDGPGRILLAGSRPAVLGGRKSYLTRVRTDARGAMACEFTQREFRFGEGEGTAWIGVRRVGDTRSATSVRITTQPGTAVAGRDFTPIDQVVTFAPFQTEATIGVPIHDDTESGTDRAVELRLGEPGNGALLGRARATLVLLDDDRPDSIDFGSKSGTLKFESDESGVPTVEVIRVLPDGGFRIWGGFESADGEPRAGFAEYAADGTLRPVPGVVPVPDLVYAPDGTRYGQSGHRFVRFKGDGLVDPGFEVIVSPAYSVVAATVLPDRRVVIGGSFDTVNGQPRRGLARLNLDGTLDPTFVAEAGISRFGTPNIFTIRSLSLQSDGKLVLGGYFPSINDQIRPALARLEVDGALDVDFGNRLSLQSHADIQSVAVEPAGSILALGYFAGMFDDVGYRHLVRLDGTGSLINVVASIREAEVTFPACGFCDADFRSLAVLPGGEILLGGWFTSYLGVPRTSWVRLNGAPLTRPRIEQAGLGVGGVFSGWIRGRAGWTYRLESSTDLHDWTRVHELTSQGVRTDFRIPLAELSMRQFYRVVAGSWLAERGDANPLLPDHQATRLQSVATPPHRHGYK